MSGPTGYCLRRCVTAIHACAAIGRGYACERKSGNNCRCAFKNTGNHNPPHCFKCANFALIKPDLAIAVPKTRLDSRIRRIYLGPVIKSPASIISKQGQFPQFFKCTSYVIKCTSYVISVSSDPVRCFRNVRKAHYVLRNRREPEREQVLERR